MKRKPRRGDKAAVQRPKAPAWLINPHPMLIASLLFVLYLVASLLKYNHVIAAGDMGEYLNNPLRILNGELPYRDFWLLFPPGEVYVPALIYKLFGLNINNVLIFLAIDRALTASAAYVLARALSGQHRYAIFVSIAVYYLRPFQVYLQVYLLLQLAAAIFFALYLSRRSTRHLLVAGLLMGAASLFRFYLTGSVAIAALIVMMIDARMQRLTLKRTMALAGMFAGALLLVEVLSLVALRSIWWETITAIFASLASPSTSGLPYFNDAHGAWKNLLRFLSTSSSLSLYDYLTRWLFYVMEYLRQILTYLAPFIAFGLLVWVIVRWKKAPERNLIVLFFTLWTLLLLPKALGRSDETHLMPLGIPLTFAIMLLLQYVVERKKEYARYLVVGSAVASLLYFIVLVYPLFITQMQRLLSSHRTVSITTPYGNLAYPPRNYARIISWIIKEITDATDEGDYIFVTPWGVPPLYALTNRRNPTYYDSLIDLVMRPSEEKQKSVCQDLLAKKTQLIVHVPTWGLDRRKERQFQFTNQTLHACIVSNFTLRKENQGVRIYTSKAPPQ